MRLYRIGDSGEAVRDIQQRLLALGFDPDPDPGGSFGAGTRDAVRGFQASRGLAVDDTVGPDTWRELVEAGYRLGDRLLYYRRPMQRGDDVAEFQRLMNMLGFDAGKVDGIFGPNSQQALLDFQHNRNLAEDGLVGPVVVRELGMVGRAIGPAGREDVRERSWLRQRPHSVGGVRVYLDPFCGDPAEAAATWAAAAAAGRTLRTLGAVPILSREADVYPPERVRARRANRLGVDLVVALATPHGRDPAVLSFATTRSHSEAGARLAGAIADPLGLPTGGRATPILKETRVPAVIVEAEPLDEVVGKAVAHGIDAFFSADRRDS